MSTSLTVTDSLAAPAAALNYDVLRAQMVNCLLSAVDLLSRHNPGLNPYLRFEKIEALTVGLALYSQMGPDPHRYVLELNDPAGAHALLKRIGLSGEPAQMDAVDQAFSQCIGAHMRETVNLAYSQMTQGTPEPNFIPEVHTVH